MTTSLHSDQPIREPEDDLFGRWPFATRMAEVIQHWNDPASLVVALYGEWGEGKTSLLNLMARSIQADPNLSILRFNAWRIGDEQQVLREFFRLIAHAIGESIVEKSARERASDLLQQYGDCLSVIPEPQTSVFGRILGGAGRFIGKGVKTRNDIESLRQQLDVLLRKCRKRIVILLDDLDRLDYHEVDAIIRLVKLMADFPYTTYVLAFDPTLVAEALNRKFSEGQHSGHAFLEKIVQVGLHIPPADVSGLKKIAFKSIENALNSAAIDLPQEAADKFVVHFERGFLTRLRSPRAAKRFGNAVAFGIPLLAGEVNIVDYLLLEAMRIFYPHIYKIVRDNGSTFVAHSEAGMGRRSNGEERKKFLSALTDGLSTEDAQSVRETIKFLFPQTESAFGGANYGSDWQDSWSRELRICSQTYFPRYFHYGVPPGDVSNKAVEELIATANNADARDLTEKSLQSLAHGQGWKTLIQKLREREKSLPSAAARNLATSIARLSSSLPKERGAFSFAFSTFGQASILLYHLIHSLPAQERLSAAQEVVRDPVPLPFAAECYRWFQPSKERGKEEHSLTAEELSTLGRELTERIAASDGKAPLLESFGDDAPFLYYIWRDVRGADEVSESLKKRFEKDPKSVQAFIALFIPTAWSMESGVPHKSDLRREQYNQIVMLVEGEKIYRILHKLYSNSDLEVTEFPHSRSEGEDRDRLWARQFCWIHRYVKKEAEGRLPADTEAPSGVEERGAGEAHKA